QISVISLVQSLETLVQRHEIFRTVFSEQDGKPVQVIAPACGAVENVGADRAGPYPGLAPTQGSCSAPVASLVAQGTGSAQGTIPTVQVPVIDLCSYPTDIQEQLVDEITQREISHPFDLSTCPLFRLRLLRLGDQKHILLFSVHHIIFDGWSLHIFIRELITLYEARIKHTSVALPPLPIQYADYAQWQRQRLQGN